MRNSAGFACFCLVALVMIAGCGAVASSTPRSQPPFEPGEDSAPTAFASKDGFTLELWLDRERATLGDRVLAFVRVTNEGDEAPTWETNTCGAGPAPITVTANNGVRAGRAWDGVAERFKRETLQAVGLAIAAPSEIGDFYEADKLDGVMACPAFSRELPFAPGEVAEALLGWDVRAREAVPIAPGAATLASTFSSAAGTLTVVTSLEIEGGELPAISLVDHIDAALEEPDFRAWLERHPAGARMDPNVTYWPNDEGRYPEMEPYLGLTKPVVEIGTFFPEEGMSDGFFGAVIVYRATKQVLGTRFE